MQTVTELQAVQSSGHVNPCTELNTGDVILSAKEWAAVNALAEAVLQMYPSAWWNDRRSWNNIKTAIYLLRRREPMDTKPIRALIQAAKEHLNDAEHWNVTDRLMNEAVIAAESALAEEDKALRMAVNSHEAALELARAVVQNERYYKNRLICRRMEGWRGMVVLASKFLELAGENPCQL